jgi:pilus assembly protein FimV
MKKTLVAMSLLAPMAAHSLGIGDIKLHSALNQKLDAEIALSLTTDETISDIKVSLAPPNKFEEAGVVWSYFVSTIKFKPLLKKNGQVIIKLTSNEVVQEPFLDFLVEVSWPKGDLFKEFTVLVDPPVVYQQSSVSAPKAAIDKASSSSAQQNKQGGRVDYSRLAVEGRYGPTKRNDSLWKVAEKINKHSDVSVEQMMMALYKANPGAFYKKIVNALMEGKTLKIPEKPDLLALTKQQASAKFYRQMAVWEGKAVAEPEIQVVDKKVNNQLKLVPPVEDSLEQADYITANTEVSQELSSQNKQLQQRLANLEEQFAIMQNMLAIKDQQLAALQNKELDPEIPISAPELTQDEVSADSDVDSAVVSELSEPPVTDTKLVEGKGTEKAESSVDDSQLVNTPASGTDTSNELVPEITPVTPPVQAVQEELVPPQESGTNYTYLGWGVFGLLAFTGIGLLLWRKRQAEEEMNENSMFAASSEIVLPEDDEEDGVAVPVFDEIPSYDVGTVGESSFLSEFTPSDFGVFETEQAEIDPTAETDVYLAYGRYQQAEDLMRQAITDHPDKDEYKLKLLEIFYASENEEGFEKFANTLIAEGKNIDLNFWSKVSEMGTEIIPDSPLFSSELRESKFEATDLTSDPLGLVGESSNADVAAVASEVVPDATDSGVGDEPDNSDIDFDLSSFALTDDVEEQSEEPSELNSLDFDLSSFESDDTTDVAVADEPKVPEDLDSFDFDFDDAGTSDATEPQQLSIDENQDISLDEFDFSADSNEHVALNEPEPSADLDAQNITNINPDSEHSSFDFDFDFDFEGVPGAAQVADEPAVEPFEQGDLNLEVSDLTDMDEYETKIDLAKAYIDMGDAVAAKEIAQEVVEKGNEVQKKEALALIEALD